MTTEQAIKELKSDRELYGSEIVYAGDGTPEGDLMLALDMGIAALKKQIPKKPIDVCTPVVTWGLCPICKGELNKLGNRPNRVFESTKYCPDCGQALDWSGDCE